MLQLSNGVLVRQITFTIIHMTLWDTVIGHNWAVDTLKSAVSDDHFGHAYLITGPDHIGKTTLARIFAQAINCTADNVEDRPCGKCRPCQLINLNRHPDIRILSGELSARGTRVIKIDDIRQLQKDLNLTSNEARYKVAIIEQFENANQSASNAFLKTLEEPPRRVILILTATDADILLPTVRSRCHVINLRPLSVEQIYAALLSQFELSDEEAKSIAHISGGRIGWAIQTVSEPDLLLARDEYLERLYLLFSQERVSRFAVAESLTRNPEELPVLLRSWITWWRDASLIAHGERSSAAINNIDQLFWLRHYVRKWPPAAIVKSLKQTELALSQIRQNANVRLVLENLFLIYPHDHKTKPLSWPQ